MPESFSQTLSELIIGCINHVMLWMSAITITTSPFVEALNYSRLHTLISQKDKAQIRAQLM